MFSLNIILEGIPSTVRGGPNNRCHRYLALPLVQKSSPQTALHSAWSSPNSVLQFGRSALAISPPFLSSPASRVPTTLRYVQGHRNWCPCHYCRLHSYASSSHSPHYETRIDPSRLAIYLPGPMCSVVALLHVVLLHVVERQKVPRSRCEVWHSPARPTRSRTVPYRNSRELRELCVRRPGRTHDPGFTFCSSRGTLRL